MGINSFIAKQFANPEGLGGKIIGIVMNRQNRPLYDETIRLLSPEESDSVLDIGCGNGFVLSLLNHTGSIAGIDVSESAVKAAARRHRARVRNGTAEFYRQDAGGMSFADRSFSKIYTINTVYFWSGLSETTAEIYRVLKPGGLFVNALYSIETLARFPHTRYVYKAYTAEQLEEAGAGAGFSVKTVPVLDGSAYCVLCKRDS